jgi:hypothetical protein
VILSRKRRGIVKTIGKVAAVAGAVHIGGKLMERNEDNEKYAPILTEEQRQEMEEIREEPEEEREGPFNIFGWLRG